MRYMKKGERVLVRKWRSDPGHGLTYHSFRGILLDDCNGEGWDVVDIRDTLGKVKSVYSFSVEPDDRGM